MYQVPEQPTIIYDDRNDDAWWDNYLSDFTEIDKDYDVVEYTYGRVEQPENNTNFFGSAGSFFSDVLGLGLAYKNAENTWNNEVATDEKVPKYSASGINSTTALVVGGAVLGVVALGLFLKK